jgi:hypothetical protein
VTQDFGQAARYHGQVIALRAPTCLSLGIATTLAAVTGLWIAWPKSECLCIDRASQTQAAAAPSAEPLTMRWQHEVRECGLANITSIVIRGQFTSRDPSEGFTLSFAGSEGHYTTMTDATGYFEVRIPREDFAGDPCELPRHHRQFTDPQLTLTYTIDAER